jgi:phage head maturation protease
MRAAVIALATIVVLTAPAYSQGRGKGRHAASEQQTEEQKKKAAEAEKAYRSALDKIPDKKYDPWGNMR